ncbi:acrylate utilization transcriptional regulator AcuR [Sedimenticola sp.]|uniref:acrylate utilization transcriptional regulator AcuR n=1 Tax=Sedimenticola sp. TaxID=1940285 RepID=UPI002588C082|nr:TetR/AcrR family transcriptional regulator [Sedimenticola sp.]MCW8905530.1 TetR/AcrR family transcriptional regulator [Sedimenticola sp.]
MIAGTPEKRGPGRPRRQIDGRHETRAALVRAGVEILTEKGFAATGIDEILRRVGVPKGSFYYYFDSKEVFGIELIESYANYFARKLDKWLLDESCPAMERIANFVADARAGMERHGFRRGCVIGNLGQEMGALPEVYRARLEGVFADWESRLACCLEIARKEGAIAESSDCIGLARFFWIGWEGAVLRAKLELSAIPLDIFADGFFAGLER